MSSRASVFKSAAAAIESAGRLKSAVRLLKTSLAAANVVLPESVADDLAALDVAVQDAVKQLVKVGEREMQAQVEAARQHMRGAP